MSFPIRPKRALPLICALTLFAAPAWAEEPVPGASVGTTTATSRAPAGAVAVQVTLANTELKESEVLQELANEFRAPVVKSDGIQGLLLSVDGPKLHARYRDAEGQVIERKIELPRDKRAQLDTIALLSGNLARDEAGEVLAELRAEQSEEATLPEEDLPEPPPLPPRDEEKATPAATKAPQAPKKEPKNQPEAPPQGPRVKNPEAEDPKRPLLPTAEFSAALWGDITYPENIGEKKSHVHLGLVHSDIGSLKGFGANLLILRNLARDRYYAGEGVELSIVWTENQGYYRGFQGAAIAAVGKGGIEGVQGAGIFTFQKNETRGAQLAGVVSVSMSDIEGGQGAGSVAVTWGDIVGAQVAGGVSLTAGDLRGAQVSGGGSVVVGEFEGFQLGLANYAGRADGFQLALANIALKRMDGFQLALGNYAGDFSGTQIGLLNIGGKVNGAQFGLVNVAKDVNGVAFAPVNIIPGIRNQIVLYESWSPAMNTAASPAGPLTHLGIKFMPEPFYTQLTFGIGAEAESCPEGFLPGDASCSGNRVLYAPAFAVGGRAMLVGGLFTEFDLQYQFESTLSSSLAHRHAVLGRAAVGYDFNKKVGIHAGGGPRMDVQANEDGRYVTDPTWAPHVFAGVQVF